MPQGGQTQSDSAYPNPILLTVYREVRIGMVVVMVMLIAAVVAERISAPHYQPNSDIHWQSALSEYYYTSAHSIFIASLLALSTLFFAYKGRNDTEDALLTLAGVCTFTAALVPQNFPVHVVGNTDLAGYNPKPNIVPNIIAIGVALAFGWFLTWRLYRRSRIPRSQRSAGGTLSLYFLRLVVAVGVISLIIPRSRGVFLDHAHGAAGVLMLSSFIATAFCTAYVVGKQRDVPHWQRYHRFYRWVAWVMLATFVAVIIVHFTLQDRWRLWILWLESLLILQFAVYWVVQTIELWDTPDPRPSRPEPAPLPPGSSSSSDGHTKRSRLREIQDQFAEARRTKNYQSLL